MPKPAFHPIFQTLYSKTNWFTKKNWTQRHRDTEFYFLERIKITEKKQALWILSSLYLFLCTSVSLCSIIGCLPNYEQNCQAAFTNIVLIGSSIVFPVISLSRYRHISILSARCRMPQCRNGPKRYLLRTANLQSRTDGQSHANRIIACSRRDRSACHSG